MRWEAEKGALLAGAPPRRRSPRASNPGAPAKPYLDFPVFPHATGRWAKKVRGKLHYFGPWGDHQAALDRWLDEKDDLLAGRTPQTRTEGLTIQELVNEFLTAKKKLMQSGDLEHR